MYLQDVRYLSYTLKLYGKGKVGKGRIGGSVGTSVAGGSVGGSVGGGWSVAADAGVLVEARNWVGIEVEFDSLTREVEV